MDVALRLASRRALSPKTIHAIVLVTPQLSPPAGPGKQAETASIITQADHRAAPAVQSAAWLAVASQPSRRDMVRAQLTTARTWSETSVARHSTDHG